MRLKFPIILIALLTLMFIPIGAIFAFDVQEEVVPFMMVQSPVLDVDNIIICVVTVPDEAYTVPTAITEGRNSILQTFSVIESTSHLNNTLYCRDDANIPNIGGLVLKEPFLGSGSTVNNTCGYTPSVPYVLLC